VVPVGRVYLACRYLFNEYPLSVSAFDHVPSLHTMVLMLRDGEDVRFFALMRIRGNGRTDYTLSAWRAQGAVEIAADGGEVPEAVANVIEQGIPIPRDGLLFGWAYQEIVTALIMVYASYRPDSPLPAWSVMPLLGTPESQWPPFSIERYFGRWFWKDYQAGNIVQFGQPRGRLPAGHLPGARLGLLRRGIRHQDLGRAHPPSRYVPGRGGLASGRSGAIADEVARRGGQDRPCVQIPGARIATGHLTIQAMAASPCQAGRRMPVDGHICRSTATTLPWIVALSPGIGR
jgi:hypothetical protein